MPADPGDNLTAFAWSGNQQGNLPAYQRVNLLQEANTAQAAFTFCLGRRYSKLPPGITPPARREPTPIQDPSPK